MKRQLATLLFITASWLQIPAVAQTYSSFFKKIEASFSTIEDSFTTTNSILTIYSPMIYKNDRASYIDRILEANQLNNASRLAGNETAILGAKNVKLRSAQGTSLLKESVRTTRNACFVTQNGSRNCN